MRVRSRAYVKMENIRLRVADGFITFAELIYLLSFFSAIPFFLYF